MKYFKASAGVLIAILIYLVFRSRNLILYRWLGINTASLLPIYYKNVNNNIFVSWLIYSLPDGLWLYSFIMLMVIIWKDENKRVKYAFALCGMFIAITDEIGQLFHIFKGTFDIGDIIAYLTAGILAVYSIKLLYRGIKNEEKN